MKISPTRVNDQEMHDGLLLRRPDRNGVWLPERGHTPPGLLRAHLPQHPLYLGQRFLEVRAGSSVT